MNQNKYLLFPLLFLAVVILAMLTQSCADDPSSLGLKFISPSETTGVKIFDSYIDTMQITSRSDKFRVNTWASSYLMVGTKGSYSAKSVIRFNYLPTTYDSATVNSAKLTLYYKNYYYPQTPVDSLGQTGFDIFKVQNSLNLQTVTLDSVNSGTFGNTSQGSYTGYLTADSQAITIDLNTTMVRDWLYVAQDTTWPNKNYGIVLSPNGGSNTIKAFYATQTNITKYKPSLQIIVTKNGQTDTITTQNAESVSFTDGSLSQGQQSFTVQSTVSYVEIMKFDVSHIPSTATINDVLVYLSVDSSNTNLAPGAPRNVNFGFLTDTTGLVLSGNSYTSYIENGKYVVRLINRLQPCPFQRWLDGQTNFGMAIISGNNNSNLDYYSFFNMNAADPQMRPRVVIKYTPRVTP